MLRTLNGKARKHGTRPTSRFQLHQTTVNILRFRYFEKFTPENLEVSLMAVFTSENWKRL